MIKYYPCITAPGLKGKERERGREREREAKGLFTSLSSSLETQHYRTNLVMTMFECVIVFLVGMLSIRTVML